jgi:hypothetical protein
MFTSERAGRRSETRRAELPGRNVGPPTFCSTLTLPARSRLTVPSCFRGFVGPDYNGPFLLSCGDDQDCPAPWSWFWLALKHVGGTGTGTTVGIQQVASPPSRGELQHLGALAVQRSYCAFDGLDDWFPNSEACALCFYRLAARAGR